MRKSVTLVFIFCSSLIYGQSNENLVSAYNWYDIVIGAENTGISNGTEYIEVHRMLNDKHKFFKSFGFLPGAVKYDGLPYYNVDLKYNVYDDILLANIKNTVGRTILQLHKEKIDAFKIDGHQFINIRDQGSYEKGFYEVLQKNNDLYLLKKHQKEENTILDKDFVYYEFKPVPPLYFLMQRGELHSLKSAENLADIFPGNAEIIYSFYSTYKEVFQNDREAFMNQLFHKITSFSQEQKDIGK